jgi:hypothetical protein
MDMKMILTTIALLALLGTAHADPLTAGDWMKFCDSKITYMQTACVQYARGVADGLDLWWMVSKTDAPVCIPGRVTAGQLVDVAKKYWKDTPKERHYAAGVFLGMAFLNAWPCPINQDDKQDNTRAPGTSAFK